MPTETTQGGKGRGPGPTEAGATGEIVSAGQESQSSEAPPSRPGPARRRKLLIGVLGALVVVAAAVFGIPWIELTFSTVSTDDAYVSEHVTFVAPRVGGQVSRVLVDDNNRVHKGELLAELDKEPFRSQSRRKGPPSTWPMRTCRPPSPRCAASRERPGAGAGALQHAVEGVDNQIALLHARVADLDKSKAALSLAQVEFDRAKQLVGTAAISRELYDQRQAELTTANANVNEALAEVYQIRVSLGLPAQPEKGESLDQVPADLDQTFSSVLQAQAGLIESAAQLGVIHSYDQSPKQMLDRFEKQGDIDRVFAQLTAKAPAVKQAEAKLEQAEARSGPGRAEPQYCDIVADDRRRRHPAERQPRQLCPSRPRSDGDPLAATRSGSMPISRRPSSPTCASASVSISMSICMENGMFSKAASPASRWGPVRPWRCCRRKTRRATSSKSCSGCRCGSSSKTMTRKKLLCSSACPSSPTSTIKEPPTGPNAGKFLQPYVPRSPSGALDPEAMPEANLERHDACIRRQSRCGGEPLADRRHCGGADFHGGAGYNDRRGRPALHRRRPFGHRR